MHEITAFDSTNNEISYLVQWDKDITISIKEPEIKSNYKVHFFNELSPEAYVVPSKYLNGSLDVDIPNVLLTEALTIMGYVYKEESTESRNIYCFKIPVRKRKKPSNYVYVDTPKYVTFEQILAECKAHMDAAATSEANVKKAETNVTQMHTAVGQAKEHVDKVKADFDTTVGQAKTDAVKAVTDEGAKQLQAVTGAGSAQVKAITDEGAAKVQAVTNEGTKQVKAVTAEGSKQLEIVSAASHGIVADRKQIQINKDDIAVCVKRIDDLAYVKIAFVSGTLDKSVNEIGSTVTAVNASWKLNKTPTTLKSQFGTEPQETLTNTLTSKSYTGKSVKTNTDITLTAVDERNAIATKKLTISFLPKIYWGVADNKSAYASADLLALSGSALAGSRQRTIDVNATTGKHILYAIPSSFGTPTFNVGGFDGGFVKVGTISHTNASGYAQNYDVWKSVNAGLGQAKVTIK